MTAARLRPGFDIFAVEDTTAQLCWASLPGPSVSFRAGASRVEVEVEDPTEPGAIVLSGLAPAATHDLVLDAGGGPRRLGSFRTLESPPGRELFRFATINDLHIGERYFGLFPRFHESPRVPSGEAYPVRCARAAIAEASAWGAARIVAKGDLTWSARPFQWDLVADVLQSSPVAVDAMLGNHDVGLKGVDGRAALAGRGMRAVDDPVVFDVEGLRLVLGDSSIRGASHGGIDRAHRDAIAAHVRDAPGPAWVALHHYIDPLPFPSRYPAGIRRSEGDPFLEAIAAANPATFVTFGHTHRHRRGIRHGLVTTEIGSTKDHPGVWAGYVVHEGGIRQVVRRISEPSCIGWTERTRRSLAGLWGPWSRGRIGWRCFSHRWPDRRR